MSLRAEIEPHLPFLQRYARAFLGNRPAAITAVRQALERIIEEPRWVEEVADARIGLYSAFHAALGADVPYAPQPDGGDEATASQRLSALSDAARAALLLTALEGFADDDAAQILNVTPEIVDGLTSEAMTEISRQITTEVLLIEDEPIIAMDLETIVRDLGHGVVGIAATREDAVRKARALSPGLILADIQLADDSSGIDAVKDIVTSHRCPVIFITAFPERLLTRERTEPTYLITKPFQRSTVGAAITQALFLNPRTAPPAGVPPSAEETIPDQDVRPLPGPVDAEVVAGQLRLRDGSVAHPTTGDEAMEALRRMHHRTAKRLCNALVGSNLGPGFSARLDAVRRILSRRLSQERSLQLAVQTKGLEAMMSLVHERLDESTALDVGRFVDDLADIVHQFPNYKAFLDQVAMLKPLPEGARERLVELSIHLEAQPDEVVDPALKSALGEVREVAERTAAPVATIALMRSVGNCFRSIARFLNRRLRSIARKATEDFDDRAGKAIVDGVVAVAEIPALLLVASLLPSEFGFAVILVYLARKSRSR